MKKVPLAKEVFPQQGVLYTVLTPVGIQPLVFQHLLRAIPAEKARRFYEATAGQKVRALGEGTRRISLDGHNLPRYTRIVELAKGREGQQIFGCCDQFIPNNKQASSTGIAPRMGDGQVSPEN